MPLFSKGLAGCFTNNIPSTTSFNPATYGTVLGWYDFSNNSKVLNGSLVPASDGDGIDTVTDQSGSSRNARQTVSGSRPIYKTNVVNSLSVGRFSGSFMQLPSSKGITNGLGGFTVTVVYNLTTTASSSCHFYFEGAGAGNRVYGQVNAGGQFQAHVQRVDGVGGGDLYGGTNSASTWYIVSYVFDVTGNLTGVYKNGAVAITPAAIDSAGSFSATNSLEDPTIGSLGLYGSTLMHGDIAEVVFWNSALGTTNRHAAEVALGSKYNITVT